VIDIGVFMLATYKPLDPEYLDFCKLNDAAECTLSAHIGTKKVETSLLAIQLIKAIYKDRLGAKVTRSNMKKLDAYDKKYARYSIRSFKYETIDLSSICIPLLREFDIQGSSTKLQLIQQLSTVPSYDLVEVCMDVLADKKILQEEIEQQNIFVYKQCS
jgi:hypothetical protein